MLVEGLAARWQRHADAAAHLQRALIDRGFVLLADPAHQLAPRPPCGCPRASTAGRAAADAREHNIEIGGGSAPAAPPMWRIGLMGVNATPETADGSWRRSTWCWTARRRRDDRLTRRSAAAGAPGRGRTAAKSCGLERGQVATTGCAWA